MVRFIAHFTARARCAAMLMASVLGLQVLSQPALGSAPEGGLRELVASVKPAVVFIVVVTDSGVQSGTGFVYSSSANESRIITANHVIEGATRVDVIFDSDEHERFPARVLRRDHNKDVAVLQVTLGHRQSLLLEAAHDIQEGSSVIVIGYPVATHTFERIIGDALRPSIHSGIVSAVRLNGDLIQFDAATDHGDSGGPVIDVSTGRVMAIVHGTLLNTDYASRGFSQPLPGSSFGPSAQTISNVAATVESVNNKNDDVSSSARSDRNESTKQQTGSANSASYRLGYSVPRVAVTEGSSSEGEVINDSVNTSVLGRLVDFLKGDNSLYLIPIQLSSADTSNSQKLSGYCDDSRLNAIAAPIYSWRLTGGPRYNGYGSVIGYSGEAQVNMTFVISDCFGIPFFVGQKSKAENRYFAHRTPAREITDMANDLLDQLTRDFANARDQHKGAWDNLLKTGIAIDPTDTGYHSMIFFAKKPKGFEVLRVAPDGPADKAGVKPQDVIVKINEKEASQMSIDEARAAINVAQYTLELQRPGGNVTLTVHAAQYASIVKALQH